VVMFGKDPQEEVHGEACLLAEVDLFANFEAKTRTERNEMREQVEVFFPRIAPFERKLIHQKDLPLRFEQSCRLGKQIQGINVLRAFLKEKKVPSTRLLHKLLIGDCRHSIGVAANRSCDFSLAGVGRDASGPKTRLKQTLERCTKPHANFEKLARRGQGPKDVVGGSALCGFHRFIGVGKQAVVKVPNCAGFLEKAPCVGVQGKGKGLDGFRKDHGLSRQHRPAPT